MYWLQTGKPRWQFLALTGASLAVVVLFVFNPGTTGLFPPCPFHWATGLYCPGCGSLRSIHQLLHGNITAAFRLNPLLLVALPAILLLLSKPAWRYHPWLPKALLALLLVYGVARNVPFAPFTWLAPG